MGLEELINDCKRNDLKAQEQLYRLFASKLFAVCLKYARNRAEAEDHLQDGFLTIFNKIEQYNGGGSFEGWMRRIMVNTVLQQYRNVSFVELSAEKHLDAEVEVEIEDESVSMEYLMGLIQALPDRYRLVFTMYVIDGYSHKEISEMLGISTGTSKSNLARARMILKEKIESDAPKRASI